MATTEDSHRLIRRVLSKDRRALEELVFLRYDWLISVACRSIPTELRNLLPPDDIVQESIAKTLHGFDQFSPVDEPSLFAWLKLIVKNTAKDLIRKHDRSPSFVGSPTPHHEGECEIYELIQQMAAKDPRVSQTARCHELYSALRGAIAELKPNYRKVIELHYFQHKSLDEIAQAMQTSVDSVRGYQQRARECLKAALIRLSLYI